jgi:hypothetical protein
MRGAFMEQHDATAIANQLVDANLFDITGPIRINYSSSSIRAVPLVSYNDADLDFNFRTTRSPASRPPRASWSPSPLTTWSTPSPDLHPGRPVHPPPPEARRSSSPRSGSRQPTVRARSSRPRVRPESSRPTRSANSGHRPARRVLATHLPVAPGMRRPVCRLGSSCQ